MYRRERQVTRTDYRTRTYLTNLRCSTEAGGDGSSGSFGCGECRALKAKLQRAERRIALLSELASLGAGDMDAD